MRRFQMHMWPLSQPAATPSSRGPTNATSCTMHCRCVPAAWHRVNLTPLCDHLTPGAPCALRCRKTAGNCEEGAPCTFTFRQRHQCRPVARLPAIFLPHSFHKQPRQGPGRCWTPVPGTHLVSAAVVCPAEALQVGRRGRRLGRMAGPAPLRLPPALLPCVPAEALLVDAQPCMGVLQCRGSGARPECQHGTIKQCFWDGATSHWASGPTACPASPAGRGNGAHGRASTYSVLERHVWRQSFRKRQTLNR